MPNISNWKFCKVKKGTKVPYPSDWQKNPLTLEQIPVGDNYGLLSGVHSGILAIDFDGMWAFNWWNNNLGINLPNTIAWTSCRENRVQYAYSVPVELWPYIKTRKWSNGLDAPNKEGIEFRWNGCQSVLPPSIHPDTGKQYQWVGENEIVDCPLEILEFLIGQNTKTTKIATTTATRVVATVNSPELGELDKVLTAFKQHYPRLSYDEWRNATWACITHAGVLGGVAAMQVFYPEQKRGEYEVLANSYVSTSAPSIASLIFAIQQRDSTFSTLPPHKNEKLILEKLKQLNNKRTL